MHDVPVKPQDRANVSVTPFVVVHDEDGRESGLGQGRVHGTYDTRAALRPSAVAGDADPGCAIWPAVGVPCVAGAGTDR